MEQQEEQIDNLSNSVRPYKPKSRAKSLDTVVPFNMSFDIQQALTRIVNAYGDIDSYVAIKLGYPSVDIMRMAFGGEQVDALAMAIDQIDRGNGFINGDQTGIGKGRTALAITRYAIVSGRRPIVITEKPGLFSDFLRDMKAIGFLYHDEQGEVPVLPLVLNNEDKATILDEDGNVLFKYRQATEIKQLLINPNTGKAIDRMPFVPEYPDRQFDLVMLTYSQIQAAAMEGSTSSFKNAFLKNIASDNILIIDEAHNAGGVESLIGKFMRDILKVAKGAFYLSATFAKNPEAMPLYAVKTSIREATRGDIVNSIISGGLPLQEIVASQLVESGQMVRRQRSNEGIVVEYKQLLEKEGLHAQVVDTLTEIMNDIVAFERMYITPVVENLKENARKEGKNTDAKPKGYGVAKSPYFSRIFNIVDQLLFSLKAQDIADEAIQLLNENKKVVIAFKSTMETFLKDEGYKNGDQVLEADLDFAKSLKKGFETCMTYTQTDIFNTTIKRRLELTDLDPDATPVYHAIMRKAENATSGIDVSPIDRMIRVIEAAKVPAGVESPNVNYRVIEVTGRSQRIVMKNGVGTIQSYSVKTNEAFRRFNSGEFDVIFINQAGSTGASAHASVEFRDQRQRAMLLGQAELDINKEMQKRGRTNRTGQVKFKPDGSNNMPMYRYIMSTIPAELRLFMMLKAKLKSLDANTTGSQNSNDSQLESEDFLNKYGDQVVKEYMQADNDLYEDLMRPCHQKVRFPKKDGPTVEENWDDAASKVTRRIPLMPVRRQREIYDEIIRRYNDYIYRMKQRGEYDLEISYLPLSSETQKRYVKIPGSGGLSPFGRDTIMEECIANNLEKPYSRKQIDGFIERMLDGLSPAKYQAKLLDEFSVFYPEYVKSVLETIQQTIDKYKVELAALPAPNSHDNEDANERLELKREKIAKIIERGYEVKEAKKINYEQLGNDFKLKVGDYPIGRVVKIPKDGLDLSANEVEFSYGVFVGFNINYGLKNPYSESVTLRFVVADGRKMEERSLKAGDKAMLSRIYSDSRGITQEESDRVLDNWDDIVRSISVDREKRLILTGNILQATSFFKDGNKLIKYNTINNEIKNGILLRRNDKEKSHYISQRPIIDALDMIMDLPIGKEFVSSLYLVSFKNSQLSNGTTYFEVNVLKGAGRGIILDESIRSLLASRPDGNLPEFVQSSGSNVSGSLPKTNLRNFLQILSDKHGVVYPGKVREAPEEESTLPNIPVDPDKLYRYELMQPIDNPASHPSTGFAQHIQAEGSKYGYVLYTSYQSDRVRTNYSLIPIYDNVQEVYGYWKEHILRNPVLLIELNAIIEKVKKLSYRKAIEELGYFVTAFSHESGNREFVFGYFDEIDLGAALYADMVDSKAGVEIDTIISQLQIEIN